LSNAIVFCSSQRSIQPQQKLCRFLQHLPLALLQSIPLLGCYPSDPITTDIVSGGLEIVPSQRGDSVEEDAIGEW